jgi:hypothetical protein
MRIISSAYASNLFHSYIVPFHYRFKRKQLFHFFNSPFDNHFGTALETLSLILVTDVLLVAACELPVSVMSGGRGICCTFFRYCSESSESPIINLDFAFPENTSI